MSNERETNIPFIIKPISKDYLWGGSRLNDDFNLDLSSIPLAEAWVCSTHPDGETVVTSGEKLSEILLKHPEYIGSHALDLMNGVPQLPILIKLIDAKEDLSVQVHPNDEYAGNHETGSLGKTEMWYVLDAKSSSTIIYGFNRDVDATTIEEHIEAGFLDEILNHVPIRKNDVFVVNPGTVHAIGAGCLIAEIQESSNITYRLYDYNRVDRHGNKRPLHIQKALDVVDVTATDAPRQPMRVLKYKKGCASELLTSCKHFHVERLLLNTEVQRDLVEYKTGNSSFHAFLVVDGCGSISYDSICDGDSPVTEVIFNFFKGDCIFIPANSALLRLHGMAQILDVSC